MLTVVVFTLEDSNELNETTNSSASAKFKSTTSIIEICFDGFFISICDAGFSINSRFLFSTKDSNLLIKFCNTSIESD